MPVVNGFVAWEEHIICHERGSRVVHYYLKDAFGGLILAVVGTERSIRHMTYVVSNEFLQAYGSDASINASTKWRARREVVDWLTSMSSSSRAPLHFSNAQINGSAHSGPFEVSVTGFACKTFLPDQMAQRKLKVKTSVINWSGLAWTCTKQLKHYPAFCRNGTTITVHSFVFVMAEEESHYLGYLEDLYEDKKGQKKVKVRWFHHNQEIMGVIPQLNPHPREVFITSHVQVISAECVDGLAAVLTPGHYEKCVAVVPHAMPSGVHMCFRQFKNNKVKPFALTKLRGYSNQAILASLDGPIAPRQKFGDHHLGKEDGEDMTQDNPVRVSGKGLRSFKGHQELESGSSLQNLAPGSKIAKCESSYPKLKLRFLRKTMGFEFVVPRSQCPSPFKVGEKIELLCQDSGIRGCWFRCRVLQVSQKRLKVQYEDLQDVDGSGNLEEWVPACRMAVPDKLGVRCSGRQTIRPRPHKYFADSIFEVGAPVDAWWSDGWWEGIVSGVDTYKNDCLQIYLPGEGKLLTVQQKNVRTSRDWIDNRWVDVMEKRDILHYLSANVISTVEHLASGCDGTASPENKAVTAYKLQTIEEDKQLPGLVVSDDLENVKEVNMRQQYHVNEINIHGSYDKEEEEIGVDEVNKGNKANLFLEKDLQSVNQKTGAVKAVEVII